MNNCFSYPKNISLINLTEVLIAIEYGKKYIITYRKMKSLEAVKKTIVAYKKAKRKKNIINNYPHLFGTL